MYKDKQKQKEANRAASQRRRDKAKGMTDVLTNEQYVIPEDKCDIGVHADGLVIICDEVSGSTQPLPANFGQADCECRHCQNNRKNGSRKIINHGPYKTAGELAENELNRVVFPSDPDYNSGHHEEYCSNCDGVLPLLEKPRQHPGKCLACVCAA